MRSDGQTSGVQTELERFTLGVMQNPVRGFLHGSAAAASVVGAVVLWRTGQGALAHQCTLLVFGASLVALFTTSSLYHSVPWSREWKARMQRLDHSMIYVLVAGTYTPIAAHFLDGWMRAAALGTTWAIAGAGIFQKAFWPAVPDGVSTAMQGLQGWLGALVLVPLAERAPAPAVGLLVAGGLVYTIGMIVFVLERPRLWPRVFSHHEVFHVLVVLASALHYTLIIRYVAPLVG